MMRIAPKARRAVLMRLLYSSRRAELCEGGASSDDEAEAMAEYDEDEAEEEE